MVECVGPRVVSHSHLSAPGALDVAALGLRSMPFCLLGTWDLRGAGSCGPGRGGVCFAVFPAIPPVAAQSLPGF